MVIRIKNPRVGRLIVNVSAAASNLSNKSGTLVFVIDKKPPFNKKFWGYVATLDSKCDMS